LAAYQPVEKLAHNPREDPLSAGNARKCHCGCRPGALTGRFSTGCYAFKLPFKKFTNAQQKKLPPK
jgi:hypothetical protein